MILAGMILGHAAMADDKWVASSSTYGGAARGGACRSDVVISDQPIIFPQVMKIDILIPMSQQAYNRFIKEVTGGTGLVIYDQGLAPKEIEKLKQVEIPATRSAIEELGSELFANMILLGSTVEMTKVVSRNALLRAAEKNTPEGFREKNLRALDFGFRLGTGKIESK